MKTQAKRALLLLIAAAMVIGMTACGSGSKEEEKTEIIVFAAASMTETLTELKETYEAVRDRIHHVHMKDAWWGHGDGTVGVFGGHVDFGDPRRYWDFRSLGRGDVNFEEIIVALNDVGYAGPLSVEWEDSRMDRLHGAKEALTFVRKLDFKPSAIAFDGAFGK